MTAYYLMNEWRLLAIQPSDAKNKKYRAVIVSGKKTVTINFGDSRYQQFKDTTGHRLFSHKDHNDPKRRAAYKARHSGYIKPGYFSAGYFGMRYLW